MSADFWAGYISGALGIVIGNPLDILKVRLQAASSRSRREPSLSAPSSPAPPSNFVPARLSPPPPPSSAGFSSLLRPFLTGTAAPVLGYGALNALLFMSYNRTEAGLNRALGIDGGTGAHLGTTWLAGAVGGLATWVVSTPTELIKCRAQLAAPPVSSWAVFRQVLATEGVRGLYFGGLVTALRDSIGYGFYFWSYELSSRWVVESQAGPAAPEMGVSRAEDAMIFSTGAAQVLLCGGLAGIVTWASIFPLDVIKTRVQTQALAVLDAGTERAPLLERPESGAATRLGAWEVAKETYRQEGIRPFFRGLAVCSVRAFVVNAFQWAAYEWIMLELGQGRRRTPAEVEG
ncbi:mitochondrial carrier [Thozetella sp. PMI_491]|nr:mitochondrial carrier [Thozetella sp. PMI_491]